MERIKAITILILTLNSTLFFSQCTMDSFDYEVEPGLKYVEIDRLQNEWRFYDDKIIRKSEDKAYVDTFLLYDKFSTFSFDLRFPLKTLVYSFSKNRIDIKNSRWGTNASLSLDRIPFFQPALVQYSSDENFWILDKISNQMAKVNEVGMVKFSKMNPFRINNHSYQPTQLIDRKNYLVAMDSTFGLFVMDDYANLIQTLPIENLQSIFEYKGLLYIQKKDSMMEYRWNSENRQLVSTNRFLVLKSKLLSIAHGISQTILFTANHRIYRVRDMDCLFQKF